MKLILKREYLKKENNYKDPFVSKKNCAFITEAGAIPHLCKLLSSSNLVAQKNLVTDMLNLSIYDKTKAALWMKKVDWDQLLKY